MQYSIAREPSNRPGNLNETDKNMFLKKTTIRDNSNSNQNDIRYNMNDTRSPIKLTSQMIMSPNIMEENTKKPLTNNNYNNNYYREEPFSQSFNVEAERQNRLLNERRRDYENPQEAEPNTDYYYKNSRSPSDINDYNTRYTYNYRRDFDYIDFNKLSHSQQFPNRNNMMMDINNNLKHTPMPRNYERYEKPFEGPTPVSRQKRSVDPYQRKKGSDMEPFYKYKNVEYYGQRDPEVFGYDQVDDRYRYYSPFRNDYQGSRYGSYTYNYYLNAPMRGDISEDFRYPPQYYYKPKQEEIKQGKVYTNLF